MDIDISVLRLMEREKDVPFAVLVNAIEEALLTAYDKTDGAVPGGRVEVNRKTGHVNVIVPELDEAGNKVESRQQGAEGYTLTAQTALKIAEKILAGNFCAGFQTPAKCYGADLILEIEGVKREDVN